MKFSKSEFLARLSSRKFLLVVAGIVFYILGGALGHFSWDVVSDAIWKIVGGYVGVEGLADIISRFKSK